MISARVRLPHCLTSNARELRVSNTVITYPDQLGLKGLEILWFRRSGLKILYN